MARWTESKWQVYILREKEKKKYYEIQFERPFLTHSAFGSIFELLLSSDRRENKNYCFGNLGEAGDLNRSLSLSLSLSCNKVEFNYESESQIFNALNSLSSKLLRRVLSWRWSSSCRSSTLKSALGLVIVVKMFQNNCVTVTSEGGKGVKEVKKQVITILLY